jgi:hypothetical protein
MIIIAPQGDALIAGIPLQGTVIIITEQGAHWPHAGDTRYHTIFTHYILLTGPFAEVCLIRCELAPAAYTTHESQHQYYRSRAPHQRNNGLTGLANAHCAHHTILLYWPPHAAQSNTISADKTVNSSKSY